MRTFTDQAGLVDLFRFGIDPFHQPLQALEGVAREGVAVTPPPRLVLLRRPGLKLRLLLVGTCTCQQDCSMCWLPLQVKC